MEHLSIDDFIRVEEHLSKKLEEACGFFKIIIVTKIDGQPLSRDQFERINRNARQLVKDLFEEDCLLLEECFPNFGPMIIKLIDKATNKIKFLHDLEWQNLVNQLS